MKPTQGDLLARALLYQPHTYGDMQRLGISTSPQKRVREWLDRHDWAALSKETGSDGLIRWVIRTRPGKINAFSKWRKEIDT